MFSFLLFCLSLFLWMLSTDGHVTWDEKMSYRFGSIASFVIGLIVL